MRRTLFTILIMGAMLYPAMVLSQIVYFTRSSRAADVVVYVASSIGTADKVVYITSSRSEAIHGSSWYITDNPAEADLRVYQTPYKGEADYTVYYVRTRSSHFDDEDEDDYGEEYGWQCHRLREIEYFTKNVLFSIKYSISLFYATCI